MFPLIQNSFHFLNSFAYHDTQGRVCDNSGAAITCRDKAVVALSSCIMERNGVDAILKDENECKGQLTEVHTESSTAAVIPS